MNSGTGWTKHRSKPLQPVVVEPVVPTAPTKSSRAFIWILVVGIATLTIGAVFWFMNIRTADDIQRSHRALASEQADTSYALLKRRIGEESAYRQYAKRVALGVVTDGQENFAGAPALAKWGHNDPTRLDSIVNKQHPIYPLNFVPQLADMDCGSGGTAELVPSAKDDFIALCDAAAAAGTPLLVTSSYRSYDDQAETYLWWVANRGEAAAERASALPGYSEHQLGLSVDFATPNGLVLEDFAGTPQQKWLSENSWKYGFIQRYTDADQEISGYDTEAWHYRYVGRPVAAAYRASKATSLEQYWHISGGMYDKAVYMTMPADAK